MGIAACSEGQRADKEAHDPYADKNPVSSGLTVDDPIEEKKHTMVSLKEISSTGEILYDNFDGDLFDCGSDRKYAFYNEDSISHLDTDLFPFQYDGKRGYADAHGNIVIDAIYDGASWFSESKAFVMKSTTYMHNGVERTSDEYSIIDTTGKELMALPVGYSPTLGKYSGSPEKGSGTLFKNGKALLYSRIADRANSHTKVLVVNENMKTSEFRINHYAQEIRTINTPQFCGVLIYYTEQNAEDKSKYNGIFALYDLTGKEIWNGTLIRSSGESIYIYEKNGLGNMDGFIAENGYMNIVNEQGKWGLLDLTTGAVKIPCQYDYLGAYSDGLIEICHYGKWGYIDINGNEVIKPAFLYANSFANGRAFVETEKNVFAVIDKSGNIVANYQGLGFTNVSGKQGYECIIPFAKGTGIGAMTAGYKKFSLITSDGRILHTVDDNSATIYVSEKYVFDGERMYEIVRE